MMKPADENSLERVTMRCAIIAAFAAIVASSCAPLQPNGASSLGVVAEPDCGLPLVIRSRFRASGMSRINSGEEVRACHLPRPDDIASACDGIDAVSGPGDQLVFPAYRISNAHCAFTNIGHTQAHCTFNLAAPNGAPVQSKATLTHKFTDLSDETTHDYLVTLWHVQASCRAAP